MFPTTVIIKSSDLIDYSQTNVHKLRCFMAFVDLAERAAPVLTTMPTVFCWPPGPVSRQSSITRFMKGSNPRRTPCTCLPPFNFTKSTGKQIKPFTFENPSD